MTACRIATVTSTVAVLVALAQPAQGDGGKVRLSRRSGPYLVTVFTTPTPLRLGRADVSVMVQAPETGQVEADANVSVHLMPLGGRHTPRSYPATRRQAINKLLQAAAVEFPASGSWTVGVDVKGSRGSSHVEFTVDVLDAPPRWLDLLPWIAWPLVPIALFALREIVVYANRSAGEQRRHATRLAHPSVQSKSGSR